MASGRRRLGVVVLFDGPVADEIEGLRRAVDDPGRHRVPPHITLVPPVNVRAQDVPAAVARIRAAAAAQSGPLSVTLGSATSFLPVNPVLYLAVAGETDRLRRLRDDVFAPPLDRKLSWPWVPHVTLGDGIGETVIEAAVVALAGYTAVADLHRVVVLEEREGRQWEPFADADLGPPARVGTGGLALELILGRMADPSLAGALPAAPGLVAPIAVTARREGEVVGGGRAWVDLEGAHVAVHVHDGHRAQGIGGHILRRLEAAAAEAGWDFPELQTDGPAGFYSARSRWARARASG